MEFKNKKIIVTGTNRGIGKALVEALLQREVSTIYATARNIESLSHFNDKRIIPITLDITNETQILDFVQLAKDTNILINNAGIQLTGSAFLMPMEEVRQNMEVNYFGTLSMIRGFLPTLEQNATSEAPSSIVNIISSAAFVGFPFYGGYSASKAAEFSITQGARLEYKHKNINVHSVNTGAIDTDMNAGLDIPKTSPEDVSNAMLDALETDEQDIAPDDNGKRIFELWKKDYKALEDMAYEDFLQYGE